MMTLASTDPFSTLEQDHQEVDELFDRFSQVEDDGAEGLDFATTKAELLQQILMKLTIHTRLEEEIIYPELRAVIEQPDLIDEAEMDHETASDLMAQLSEMQMDDPELDVTVETLAQIIRAHVAQEESEIFQMGRDSDLDAERVASALESFRLELMQEASMPRRDDDSGRAPM